MIRNMTLAATAAFAFIAAPAFAQDEDLPFDQIVANTCATSPANCAVLMQTIPPGSPVFQVAITAAASSTTLSNSQKARVTESAITAGAGAANVAAARTTLQTRGVAIPTAVRTVLNTPPEVIDNAAVDAAVNFDPDTTIEDVLEEIDGSPA